MTFQRSDPDVLRHVHRCLQCSQEMSEHPMCLQWRRRLANQRKRLTNLWIAEPRRKGTKETSFLRVPVRKSIRSIKSITTQCNSWNSITWQPSHRQTRLPTPARTGPIKMAKAMEQGWAARIDLENQIRKHRKVLMELLWPHQICNLCRWPCRPCRKQTIHGLQMWGTRKIGQSKMTSYWFWEKQTPPTCPSSWPCFI